MEKTNLNDPFLDKWCRNYAKWLNEGLISYSSKVIPVSESFGAKQWVLPTEQVKDILEKSNSIAVQNCECRTHYKRCDKPLEVCLLINKVGDKFVSKGKARHISLTEAVEVLKQANESGLIHLSLYMPDHEVYALCSCCSCCCHDFQIAKLTQRKELIFHSDYVTTTNFDACIHCGECCNRCVFDARVFSNDKMKYDINFCLGCGLCVSICPVGATSMILRNSIKHGL